MTLSEKLLAFFRAEFTSEERAQFARLKRVPDSYVRARLRHYQSLSPIEKERFVDCCAHWAHRQYGFVIQAPDFDHTKHPFFHRWNDVHTLFQFGSTQSVAILRTKISQYKMDKRRGVPSSVSEEEFRFAESVKSVKAPELRKRVRVALAKVGYQRKDELGDYCCNWKGQEFNVHVDFGSRVAQLRYWISLPEFHDVYHQQFSFERALGMGFGDWNYIVEENVEDVFWLFEDLVRYAIDLPIRIRDAT
jgi:hypothetical protein